MVSKKLHPLHRPLRALRNSTTIAVLAASVAGAGCGKEPNTPRALLHFSHAFPEAPRALDLSRGAVASEARVGGALIARDLDVIAVDRDNGTLVRLDAKSLATLETIAVGTRPEQIVMTPSGDLWVGMRGTGEVVHLTSDLQEIERVRLGVDVFGLALSPDGEVIYATLPSEGQLVTLRRGAHGFEVETRVAVGDLPRGLAWVPAAPGNSAPALIIANQGGMAHRVQLDSRGYPDLQGLTEVTLRDANAPEFKTPAGETFAIRTRVTQPTRAITVAVNPEDGTAYIAHVIAATGDPNEIVMAPFNNDEEKLSDSGGASGSSDGGYGSQGGQGGMTSREFATPLRPIETTVTTIAPGTSGSAPIEPSLAVRDTQTGEPLLHLVDQPSDMAHHPTMSLLFVVAEGTDNVIAFSTAEGDAARSPVAIVEVGRAPRAIAFSPNGEIAFVLNGFDFSVSKIDLKPLMAMPTIAARDVVAATPGRDDSSAPSMFMGAPSMPPESPDAKDEPGFEAPTEIREDGTPDSLRVKPMRLNAAKAVSFAKDPWPAELREGAYLFTFARNDSLSHAGQFACGTCHFEGTEDKMTWVTPDGLRQTMALAGRLPGTAPFNWNGSEVELAGNMNKTISRMGGEGLTPAELTNLESFLLNGLLPMPNPHRDPSGELTAQQAEGEALFNDADVGCASCHQPGNAFVDGLRHDVGTADEFAIMKWEMEQRFRPEAEFPGRMNTPSLRGLFSTAPYLHDGSAPDLLSLFERTGDTMGRTSHLSKPQLDSLVAYLQTL